MSNETWIKIRAALPTNDDARIEIAYESADGTVSEPDYGIATGRVLNRYAALYPNDVSRRPTAAHSTLCWRYVL